MPIGLSGSTPNPPSRATGVQPVEMKNAVINPHAMNAAMFGMIIPDRNVPNFCTATRLLDVLPAGAAWVLTTDPLPSGRTRGRTVPRTCGNNPYRTRPDGPTHFDDHNK